MSASEEKQIHNSPPSPEGGRAFRQQVIEAGNKVCESTYAAAALASARFALQQARETLTDEMKVLHEEAVHLRDGGQSAHSAEYWVGARQATEGAAAMIDALLAELDPSSAVPVREQQEPIEQGAWLQADVRAQKAFVEAGCPVEHVDSGAGLAAAGNDTGSSPTETASEKCVCALCSHVVDYETDIRNTIDVIHQCMCHPEYWDLADDLAHMALVAPRSLASKFHEHNAAHRQSRYERPYVVIPEGTLIHVGGFPFRSQYGTVVEGSQANLDLALQSLAGNQPSTSGIASTAASPAQKDQESSS